LKSFAWLIALALSVALGYEARATEIVRWERLPIPVPLIVGQERVIFLDRNVRVGVPAVADEHLQVQSANGAIYLRADALLESTRLQLEDTASTALILLDVSAAPAAAGQPPLEPLRIMGSTQSARTSHGDEEQLGTPESPAASKTSEAATPVPVVLTRYAAQSLYAPLRTIEAVRGITRVPIRRDLNLDALLPTLSVRATALIAWRLNDYWVTAVRLTNASTQPIRLDPRALQGDYIAATFQHHTLGPMHDSSDTTVAYLITRGHGLAESLLPNIPAIDATTNLPHPARADETTPHTTR
jgi:integrating conjugative element protein (TIGR03749 family)